MRFEVREVVHGIMFGYISVPSAPYITSDDRLTAVIVSQTSITLIGNLINSSDTYAVVGLLEDGTRISNFTRIQSTSADGNVTLDNLEPGKSYTVEVVSVIGTSTDCGFENITDSEISFFTICTGKRARRNNFRSEKGEAGKKFGCDRFISSPTGR